MSSLHELAEAARRDLMLCALALDDALPPRTDLFDMRRTLGIPLRRFKLARARAHRAAAKRHLARLHAELHDHAALGVRNGELWSAITRAIDALALSRWLNTTSLAPADVHPSRATVHLLLGELATVIGQLHELAWPDERG